LSPARTDAIGRNLTVQSFACRISKRTLLSSIRWPSIFISCNQASPLGRALDVLTKVLAIPSLDEVSNLSEGSE
jgi:hypothetical protein